MRQNQIPPRNRMARKRQPKRTQPQGKSERALLRKRNANRCPNLAALASHASAWTRSNHEHRASERTTGHDIGTNSKEGLNLLTGRDTANTAKVSQRIQLG